jgi:hypothetical protein
MSASMNIQAQLDKLKASLNPTRSTPSRPAFQAQYGGGIPDMAQYPMPLAGFVPPGQVSDALAPIGLVKKYGKYMLLGLVVIVLVVLFIRRRSAMMSKAKLQSYTIQPQSVPRIPLGDVQQQQFPRMPADARAPSEGQTMAQFSDQGWPGYPQAPQQQVQRQAPVAKQSDPNFTSL